jgi:beta-lactamase class A
MQRTRLTSVLILSGSVTSCGEVPPEADAMDIETLEAALTAAVVESGAEVGLSYRSLGNDPDSVMINADLRMHAASTMKVPLMMQLYLDHEAGDRPLDSELPVKRTFTSIVDGSDFDLPPESDSDTTFYGRVGENAPVRDVIDRMITWSSNLATNLLIEVADGQRVTALLREMGADSMEVLRGVEDLEAFRAGLSNTATARDLGIVMREVAEGRRFSPESRADMLDVLERQHFRDNIPAGLPAGTRVANKTGWITGINHDAAIVFPDGRDPYVLVVMVRGHPAEDQGTAFAADVSRLVWEYHMRE